MTTYNDTVEARTPLHALPDDATGNHDAGFDAHQDGDAGTTRMSAPRVQRVLKTLRQFATLSELLRIAGAAIMVGSLSLFMLQGWLEGNDIQRYLKLLAQTLILTAGGFGLSAWLKEHKGARLFFGISLASVAANFTILGALLYSLVQFDGLLGSYPNFAAWTSQSPLHVAGVILLAIAVLVPVTRLGFTVLARPAAKWLTTTYLMGGALLLLPVRSSVWSSLLAAALVACIVWTISKNRSDDRAPGTTESTFSTLLLFLPPIILCVRSFYFYSIEALALACMVAAAFILMRHMSLRSSSMAMQKCLDVISMPLPLLTAAALTTGLAVLPEKMLLPAYAFFLMPMMAELTLRRPHTSRSVVFGMVGALNVCAALLVNQLFFAGFAVALTGLLGTLLVALAGYWLDRRGLVVTGLLTAGVIGAINVGHFLKWFNVNNWLLLSVLGASVIILASLLDRYGAALKLRLDAVRARTMRA